MCFSKLNKTPYVNEATVKKGFYGLEYMAIGVHSVIPATLDPELCQV